MKIANTAVLVTGANRGLGRTLVDSKRERRRVIAQCDAIQCAEGVTRGERTHCSRDQRVHRNRVTLVTPTISIAGAKCFSRETTTVRMELKR